MREHPFPNPINRSNPIGRGRRDARRVRAEQEHIRNLAARVAEAIRFSDRDALDQAQGQLHRIDRDHTSGPDPTR